MMTLYWFSGTGNSLHAAKVLSEALGGAALIQMTNTPPTAPVGGKDNPLGFVFPSYYGDLPRIVHRFIKALNILPDTDLIAVVTMGALGQGSVKALAALLLEKKLVLRYGTGVRMPANYILRYDPAIFGAASTARVKRKLDKAEKRFHRIAGDISSGTRLIRTHPITAKTLYSNIENLDTAFTATDKCTGCSLCADVCPVGNIRMEKKRPIWRHRCEHCVACISYCPAAAIEYGTVTAKRTRYRNPRVVPFQK